MLKTLNTMTGAGTCNPVKRPSKPVCGERRKPCGEHPGATALVQPFPTEGVLGGLDLTKPKLERRAARLPGKIRSYKMISVSLDEEGQFQQEGSGPNYQGGCLTLCTCQRVFRAEKKNPDEWRDDWWVAGFTSRNFCGRIWLFYLAQVEQVYASQAELWKAMPGEVRRAKSTRWNRLGDLYQPDPAAQSQGPFDAGHYYAPMVGHSHHLTASDDGWKTDIEFYHPTFQRHPVLLVAKPELTFLWQTPLLYLKNHPRNKTWDSVAALLTKLLESA